MEITHSPNKGKTYQLFDKDRPYGKDKYFKADKVKSASVKAENRILLLC